MRKGMYEVSIISSTGQWSIRELRTGNIITGGDSGTRGKDAKDLQDLVKALVIILKPNK